MNDFHDSSNEMHNDPLTPDVADRLLDGENTSLELAHLSSLLLEIRDVPRSTPTPAVSGALTEFVGVGLTTTTTPPSTAEAVIVPGPRADGSVAVEPRRKSVLANIAAFCGTLSGKIVVGGTLAAASVSGAHATGVVDVPLLPDTPARVETVDTELTEEAIELADSNDPDALAFREEERIAEKDDSDEPEAKDRSEENEETEVNNDGAAAVDNIDEYENLENEMKEHREDGERAVEPEPEEDPKPEPEPEEDPKPEPEPEEEPKPEPEEDPKPEPEPDPGLAELLEDLEEQLHRDKAAVRAEATELIRPLEAQRAEVEEALELALAPVDEEWGGYVEALFAELEETEDPERRVQLEEQIEVKYGLWENARNEVLSDFTPTLSSIEDQLETIEIERDAEIERLIAAFLTAVEELENAFVD